jgi:hypothetical protein
VQQFSHQSKRRSKKTALTHDKYDFDHKNKKQPREKLPEIGKRKEAERECGLGQ